MTVRCSDLLGVAVVLYGELTLYALFLLTPPALFLGFLLWKLPSAVRILRETPIGVRRFRSSSLAFLWLICFANIGRMAIQVLIPPSLSPVWKVTWLVMRFMLMFCQVAVAAFIFLLILHDVSFEQVISSLRMDRFTRRLLAQTLIASTATSTIDSVIQGLLLFAFDEGIYSTESTGQEGAVYWIIRAIVFVVIYIGLLVLLYAYPPTEVSASLSETKRYWWYGTKIFHTYCWVMLFFSAFELLGWILILVQIDAGECVIGLQIFLYYSLFPPLVYLVFMAKFFQTAEHWPLTSGRAGWFSGDRQECSNEDDQRRQKRRRELQQWMIEQEQQSERRQMIKDGSEFAEGSPQSYLLPTFTSTSPVAVP